MKYLINSDGQMIVFKKVMRSEDKVAYTKYDNGICMLTGNYLLDTTVVLDRTIIADKGYNLDGFMEYIGLETLLAAEQGFVVTTDEKGWAVETGSTGNPTACRVYIPNDLLGKVINTGNALDQLIKAIEPLSPWVRRGERSSVQYLEELLPEHKAILEAYIENGIKIDYKE